MAAQNNHVAININVPIPAPATAELQVVFVTPPRPNTPKYDIECPLAPIPRTKHNNRYPYAHAINTGVNNNIQIQVQKKLMF